MMINPNKTVVKQYSCCGHNQTVAPPAVVQQDGSSMSYIKIGTTLRHQLYGNREHMIHRTYRVAAGQLWICGVENKKKYSIYIESNARSFSITCIDSIIPNNLPVFCTSPYVGVYWLLSFPHANSGQYAKTAIELWYVSLITRRLHFFTIVQPQLASP